MRILKEFRELSIKHLSVKSILGWRNYLLVYLIILILFNFLLLEFPLTNVFGFEFSALNAFLLTILSGIFTLSVLTSENDYKLFLKKDLPPFILFLIIPMVVSITHDLLTINCSVWDGLLFYTFITLPSVIVGAALAVISVIISPRFRYLLFIIIFLGVLAITFFEFYYNPQIYFYNPVYAYYPGTIYDEAVEVNLQLMIYRSLNLLFFGAIFFIGSYVLYRSSVISKKLVIYITVLIAALFLYLSPDLGFSTTQKKLKSVLGDLVRTEHFDIYFSPGIGTDEKKIITLNHEYYYKQLSGFYHTYPKEKYVSFIFRDDEQKKKYFGSENADVAKPWLREVFTIAENYNSSLRHEIAHCFAGEFGWGLFDVADNFNPALIEGAAVAGAPEYDLNNVHYMASLAYHNGFRIELKNLFKGLNFFGQTSGLSYIYAGSFSLYLINKYGIEKFKRLYSDIDFQKIYGRDISGLSDEYFSFISKEYNAGNKNEAEYYFGRKPIIYKVCPRYVADRLRDAWQYYTEQNYKSALDIFTEILTLTNNYSALTGYANSLFKTGNKADAVAFLKNKIGSFKNTAYYYNIEFRLADFCAQVQDTICSDSLYNKLVEQNPNRTLYYLSHFRRNLLQSDSLIIPYLEGSDVDKYLIVTGMNKDSYDYFSLPVLIDLAGALGENYNLFLGLFDKTIMVDNYPESFAVYRLSVYLLAHLDFSRARKMAALSMRYNNDKNFNFILRENFNKADWLYVNGNRILSSTNFK